MMQLWDFLARLSPLTRKSLLSELERLELCGVEVPRSADIQARLRAEFGADNSDKNNTNTPPRLFFAPLNPLLSEGAPEHANSGKIARVSLDPIWEWIYAPLGTAIGVVADRLNHLQFLTIRQFLTLVFCTLVILLLVLALWS